MINKRGNLLDWFVIIVILFVTSISIFAAYIVVSKVNAGGIFSSDTGAQFAIDKAQSTILGFDNLMLFIIVGLSIFVLISSAVVFSHPAFFFIGTILLFIAITVAGVISNAFWTFTQSPEIATTAAAFPKIVFLMDRLPMYILFMGMAAMVVMYVGYLRQ